MMEIIDNNLVVLQGATVGKIQLCKKGRITILERSAKRNIRRNCAYY